MRLPVDSELRFLPALRRRMGAGMFFTRHPEVPFSWRGRLGTAMPPMWSVPLRSLIA